jgi:hypothetical protein
VSNNNNEEKIFADGFIFRMPPSNAPSWVIGKLSIKVDEAIEFLKARSSEDGWCNLEIKEASSGKPYIELNTWKPDSNRSSSRRPEPDTNDGDDEFDF